VLSPRSSLTEEQHKSPTTNIIQSAKRSHTISQAYDRNSNRKFSGDESFLKDPNAFNDAKNTAALQVVDEPVGPAAAVDDRAEDKSRL
jgi:hypothetical protein